MKIRLLEEIEIQPGLTKPKGTLVVGLPDAEILIEEGKAERFQKEELNQFPLLVENGYTTTKQVRNATDEELLQIDGIGPKTLEDIRTQTNQ